MCKYLKLLGKNEVGGSMNMDCFDFKICGSNSCSRSGRITRADEDYFGEERR